MKINFINETDEDIKEFTNIIKKVLKKKKGIMNIIFVNNEKIQQINKEYRNIDKITDVISFALNDSEFPIKTKELGDIFISINKAREQANEYNHSIIREISFLSVHGYLHLLGYDHNTLEEEEVMFKLQDEILLKANIRR